ncbi:MAG: porin [Akkermansiaceae bacterium]|nr:porin [Akkermansiaceae bacterium]
MLAYRSSLAISIVTWAISSGLTIAELRSGDTTAKESKNLGDWCKFLEDKPGELYDDKDNPYVQYFQVFGRFHWQYADVDGEGAFKNRTRGFHYNTTEIRRFRLGARLKFLNCLEAKVRVNLSDDLKPIGGSRHIEYANIYTATLGIDLKEIFGFDAVDEFDLSLGKERVSPTSEGDISSRYIKTVERTSLHNYISTPSLTGLSLSSEWGQWNLALGVYSGDEDREISSFDNGYFYTLHAGYKFKDPKFMDKSRVDLRVFMNGDEEKNSSRYPSSRGVFNQKWVVSLSAKSKIGMFSLLTDLIYGDNGIDYDYTKSGRPISGNPDREGAFWGVIILPSYWLIEDRLEAVFRYQYVTASRKEGYRISSRYSRIAGEVYNYTGPNDLSNGRGDRHHSAYLGLNYYLCGDNAKIMTGIEYDELKSGNQDVYSGTTIWTAFRIYF